MFYDDSVARDFSDLDREVLAIQHRIAVRQGNACEWTPGYIPDKEVRGVVHAEQAEPPGGSLRLGSYPVPKSGEQGLRLNRKQRREQSRRRRQAEARADRIVRAMAFGPTHKERVAKQHAIRNAAHVQEQVTDLTDKLLEARAQLRKAQPKREPTIKDLILADLKKQARERVDWDRKKK